MKRISIPGFPKEIAKTRFIGKQVRSLADIEFDEGASQLFLLCFDPGEKRPLHKHDELRVTFVRSGTGTFLIEGKEQVALPGDIVMTLPSVEHSLEVVGNEPLVLAELVISSVKDSTARTDSMKLTSDHKL